MNLPLPRTAHDTATDIQDLQVTHAPQAPQRVLEALLQNAPQGIVISAQRRLVLANPAFCRMFGYSQDQALRLHGRDLFPSDAVYAEVGRCVAPLLSRGQPVELDQPMQRADGRQFPAHLVAYVVDQDATEAGTIWMISDRSESVRSEQASARAILENQIILDSAAIGIVYLKNRTVERCNPKAEQIFGYAPGQMLGINTRNWYAEPGEYERVGNEVYPAIAAGTMHSTEQTMQRQDGSRFWSRLTGKILDPANPIGGASIWAVEDLSGEHRYEQELIGAKTMLQAVIDAAKVSIIVTDEHGTIRLMNSTSSSWFGYSPDELIGQATPRLLHDPEEVVAYSQQLSAELGERIEPGFDAFVVRARRRGSDEHEWTYVRRDGSRFPVHLTTSVLRDGSGTITGYVGVAIDITDRHRADSAQRVAQAQLEERVALRTAELARANQELHEQITQRQAAEEKLRQMALFDTLTGLPNRNLLVGRLEKAIAAAERRGGMVGLMFIDLDHFKHVNDTLGHEAGDLLLQSAAQRMQRVIRVTDTLARHGGDEFVLLIPEVTRRQELSELASRLVQVFDLPFDVRSQRVATTPSIGIACYPDDSQQLDSLLHCADSAMYEAKRLGKNRFQFYQGA